MQGTHDSNFANRVLTSDGKDGVITEPGAPIRRANLETIVHRVHKCVGQLHAGIRVKRISKR